MITTFKRIKENLQQLKKTLTANQTKMFSVLFFYFENILYLYKMIELICPRYKKCNLRCEHKSVHQQNDSCKLICVSGKCNCISSEVYYRKEKLEKIKNYECSGENTTGELNLKEFKKRNS